MRKLITKNLKNCWQLFRSVLECDEDDLKDNLAALFRDQVAAVGGDK